MVNSLLLISLTSAKTKYVPATKYKGHNGHVRIYMGQNAIIICMSNVREFDKTYILWGGGMRIAKTKNKNGGAPLFHNLKPNDPLVLLTFSSKASNLPKYLSKISRKKF